MKDLKNVSLSGLTHQEIGVISRGQDHSKTNRSGGAVSVEDVVDFGAGFICGLFGLCAN